MIPDSARPGPRHANGGWIHSLVLCLLILGGGAGALYYIYSTEPTAQRVTATRDTAMLVETTRPDAGTFRPTIEAMGTVKPARDVILRPRVRGEVLERSDSFTPGGFVEKGDTVVQIDPADYEHVLKQRRANLEQAKSDLQLEQGRQQVAEEEFNMVEDQLSAPENKELMLRKPQLKSARAAVETARTAVEQAKLDLKRTSVRAPFDARVITRDVNVGSQVAAGDRLARLIGYDHYWVEVRIPLSRLRWLSMPDGSSTTSKPDVRIRDRNAWPADQFRTGRLYKQIGVVGDETRMARVLIEVPDPLARKKEHRGQPELLIDAPVQVRIDGRELPDAVRLNRDYVRKNDTVWVMSDGALDIRNVDVAVRDDRYAYIRSGLSGSDRVVTTNLTTVSDGAALRRSSGETNDDGNENPSSSETPRK